MRRLNSLADAEGRDVAEAAVEVLWPRHTTLQAVTDHIERGHISPRRVHVLFDAARHDDLRPLLAWATTYLERPGEHVAAAAQGVAWAVDRLEDLAAGSRVGDADVDALAGALAALAARTDLDDHAYSDGFPDHQHLEPQSDDLRRRLGSRLLELVDRNGWHQLLWGPLRYFPAKDRIYWAQQYPTCSATAQERLAEVLRAGPRRDLSAEQKQALQELAASHPELAALIEPWWTPRPETPSEAAERQRREAEEARWRFAPDRISALLQHRPPAAAPEQVREWWRRLTLAVGFRTKDGTPPKVNFDDVLDLTATEFWSSMEEELRRHVAQAGAWALEHCRPVTPDHASVVLGFTLADAPEVLALSVLQVPPTLAEQRWAGLALVLMVAQVRREDTDLRRRLLREAVRASGDELRAPLREALGGLSEFVVGDAVATLIDAAPEYQDEVAAWAATRTRDFTGWLWACRALAAAGHQQVLASVRAALPVAPYTSNRQINSEWLQGAALLLQYGPESDREQLWGLILADRELTKAWAQSGLVEGAKYLSPTQLGRMFDHLVDAGLIQRDRATSTPFLSTMPAVPNLIARFGTPEAVNVLEDLVARYPDWPQLPPLLRQSALMAAEHGRERPNWPTLRDLTRKKDLRLVQDAHQLADLAMDTLQEIQQRLTGPNGLAPLLWNRTADQHDPTRRNPAKPNPLGWWPLWEQDLSDLVHHLLEIRLRGHRVLINREVQLNRKSRLDILLQAVHPQNPEHDPITVIIEVKGCWNPQVDTSLQQQLTDQYLRRNRKAAGIYLVGYFDSDHWGKKPKSDGTPGTDSRKSPQHPQHTLKTLRAENDERARQASSGPQPLDVRAFVLNCCPDPTITAREESEGA